MSSPTEQSRQPWGRVLALLAACPVVLIGIWNGLDPDQILWRAVIVGLVVALSVTAIGSLWQQDSQSDYDLN